MRLRILVTDYEAAIHNSIGMLPAHTGSWLAMEAILSSRASSPIAIPPLGVQEFSRVWLSRMISSRMKRSR